MSIYVLPYGRGWPYGQLAWSLPDVLSSATLVHPAHRLPIPPLRHNSKRGHPALVASIRQRRNIVARVHRRLIRLNLRHI